jgi:hypothetical protein
MKKFNFHNTYEERAKALKTFKSHDSASRSECFDMLWNIIVDQGAGTRKVLEDLGLEDLIGDEEFLNKSSKDAILEIVDRVPSQEIKEYAANFKAEDIAPEADNMAYDMASVNTSKQEETLFNLLRKAIDEDFIDIWDLAENLFPYNIEKKYPEFYNNTEKNAIFDVINTIPEAKILDYLDFVLEDFAIGGFTYPDSFFNKEVEEDESDNMIYKNAAEKYYKLLKRYGITNVPFPSIKEIEEWADDLGTIGLAEELTKNVTIREKDLDKLADILASVLNDFEADDMAYDMDKDFFGAKQGSEEADDILFALQAHYGKPNFGYDDFRKMNLTQVDVNKAIQATKKDNLNKHSYFEKKEKAQDGERPEKKIIEITPADEDRWEEVVKAFDAFKNKLDAQVREFLTDRDKQPENALTLEDAEKAIYGYTVLAGKHAFDIEQTLFDEEDESEQMEEELEEIEVEEPEVEAIEEEIPADEEEDELEKLLTEAE